jgi:hypothetical protein
MSFRSLREFPDLLPRWVQRDLADRRYELRAGGSVVATLRWERAWGSLATGETAEGRWTIKRTGFLRPRVTVREAGSETQVALVSLHSGGTTGEVKLADEHEFRWNGMTPHRAECAFTSVAGEPLVTFRPRFVMMQSEAEIEIEKRALALPELSLLALLGWYLIVLINEETVAAGVP